jgi:integrase
MERRTQPYSIQKRPTKRKNRYMHYVKFRDPETGDYGNAVSSGYTNRDDAVRWAEKQVASGLVASKNPRFKDYVEGFWDRDSRYAQGRIAREKAISDGTLEISKGNTEKHLVPKWGSLRLQSISAGQIDSWVIDLHKNSELKSATINKLLQTLRTLLGQAAKDKILLHNPAREVEPLKEHPEERGTLTTEELQKLFELPDIWPDDIHRTINLLAACTGMRLGEIRGLGLGALQDGSLSIHRSWEQRHGFKDPKCGSFREIPLCKDLSDALARVKTSTAPEDILFYGRHRKTLPLSKSVIEKYFREALPKIGVSDEERKARNLTFHSYRHSVITILRSAGVADSKVHYVAGHKQSGIQGLYTHYGPADLNELAQFQECLLNPKGPSISALKVV